MWRLLADARTRVWSGNAQASRLCSQTAQKRRNPGALERNRNTLRRISLLFFSCNRLATKHMRLQDKHGRFITDLRVSITDRCNYKCVYCRTGNEGAQYSE